MTDILQSLRCDRVANDRRRHPRVGLRERVRLETSVRRAEPRQVWMRDLSEGGAALLVSEALGDDQSVLLHLPLGGAETVPVRCRVVHCAKVGAFWRVGVEFLSRPWRDKKPPVIDATTPAPPQTAGLANQSAGASACGVEAEMRRISSAVLD